MGIGAMVSAIIVNYNGEQFIADCLDSLIIDKSIQEIIIVDNASMDNSIKLLKNKYPMIKLILAETNLGFGRACNIAVSAAQGDFLLLLNYDATLSSGLTEAVAYLIEHPNVSLVGGRLFYPNGQFQPSVGYRHAPLRLVFSWTGLCRLFPNVSCFSREILNSQWYNSLHHSIEWTSGALMLVRRTEWEKIGGMDPDYFLYVEDVDLCVRLKNNRTQLDFLPSFRAVHQNGGGIQFVSLRALLSTIDSYNIYLCKNYGSYIAKITLFFIGWLFFIRSMIFTCMIWREHQRTIDALVYLKGAKRAILHACGCRFPWGPPV